MRKRSKEKYTTSRRRIKTEKSATVYPSFSRFVSFFSDALPTQELCVYGEETTSLALSEQIYLKKAERWWWRFPYWGLLVVGSERKRESERAGALRLYDPNKKWINHSLLSSSTNLPPWRAFAPSLSRPHSFRLSPIVVSQRDRDSIAPASSR